MKRRLFLLFSLSALTLTSAALAFDKVKVGMIVTLSGPSAVLGGQVRDGFALAVRTLGGKLGDLDADVIVVDDELKPDIAVTNYEAALPIDSAINGAGGRLGDHDALRAELKQANFTSTRGRVKFNVNNYPIQACARGPADFSQHYS
jgi:ABC-type branched-subunit amino acid transport system substrate-binding protein